MMPAMRVVPVVAALLLSGALGALGGRASAQGVAGEGEVPTAQLALMLDPALSTCPSERVIRRTVAAHLGWDPFRPVAPVRIVASLRRDGDAIEANVAAYDEAGDPVGERTVRSETLDCAEVARALALAISVAVDPFVMTRAGGADVALVEEPDVVREPEVVVPEDEVVAPEDAVPVPEGGTPLRWALGLQLGVALGAVPAPRPYLGASLSRNLARGSLGFGLRHDFRGAASGVSGGTARASRTRLELVGCAGHRGFLACGNAGFSVLHAVGAGVTAPRRAQAFVPSLGAALGYRHTIGGRAQLSGWLGVDVPLVRAALEVQYEVAYTLPLVSPSLGVRLDWGLP